VKSGIYSVPQFLSKDSKELISRMLCVDPSKRITIDEVKLHPWLQFHTFQQQQQIQQQQQQSMFQSIQQAPQMLIYSQNSPTHIGMLTALSLSLSLSLSFSFYGLFVTYICYVRL
jgi:serine/threonine protein kinase